MSHSHHSAPPTRRATTSDLYCGLSVAFSILLFITFVIILDHADHTKKPQFDLQQVSVQYVNVSVNGPTASVSLAVRMLFKAENHNSFSIKYGPSSFNITYRGIPLGCATLPGFYLDAHVKRVQTTVTVDRVNVDAADLVSDAWLNDRVELRIMGDVNVKMPFVFGTRTITVSIDCVIAISPKKQALTSKLCGSDVLNV